MNVMSNSGFETVSFEQFQNDIRETIFSGPTIDDDYDFYDGLKLPERATRFSAGYDFFFPFDDYELKTGETIFIPTGIRCAMDAGNVLLLMPRSSWGFKYRVRLDNTIGVIDSDYYNAENEGHIMCSMTNEGNKDFVIYRGDKFMQGVFVPFFTFRDNVDVDRKGGMGSTDENK